MSRADALELLKEADTAAEAAEKALKIVLGDVSGEDLDVIENVLKKIEKKLYRLKDETKKSKKKMNFVESNKLLKNIKKILATLSTFEKIKKNNAL